MAGDGSFLKLANKAMSLLNVSSFIPKLLQLSLSLREMA
jgi:hypothetical protein